MWIGPDWLAHVRNGAVSYPHFLPLQPLFSDQPLRIVVSEDQEVSGRAGPEEVGILAVGCEVPPA